jgi:ABC-type polysaccharide/polyol phosphate transport system ATPase subunit
MSELAIKVEGLYKQYYLGNTNFNKPTNNLLKKGFRNKLSNQEDIFWALQNISFEVNKGEVFGIIGANGAGKSTLLKILSGITSPTKGNVHLNGRIASLLEVGTGFHPELTGRENVFMNGSLLGMKKKQIKSKFDKIVAFSEIGKFIDTPVKRYSSGMQVRLAFAVAIHLDAEILIIDEVLSVGDFAFQQKSMKAIKSKLKKNTTVLMVSHNIDSIRNLCDKVIVLNEGKMESFGDVGQQTSLYLSKMHEKEEDTPSFKNWNSSDAPGNRKINVTNIGIKARTKNFGEKIFNEDELAVILEFDVKEKIDYLDVAFRIKDTSEKLLLGVINDQKPTEKMLGTYKAICYLPSHIFNEGQYYIDLRFLRQKEMGKFFYLDNVIALTISKSPNSNNFNKHPCPLKLNSEWVLQNINSHS